MIPGMYIGATECALGVVYDVVLALQQSPISATSSAVKRAGTLQEKSVERRVLVIGRR